MRIGLFITCIADTLFPQAGIATVSVLAIVIFSVYILYDVQSVVNGGETSYVSATLRIYLDLYNVFTNLLAILSIFGGGNRN